MKTAKTMMSLLLLSAVCVTPAYANWFSHAGTNTNLNIGSAPNPTPADLRAIGDSHTVAGPARLGTDERFYDNGFNEEDAYVSSMSPAALADMEGKSVFGSHGERLGYILAIDHHARMVELQTPGGVAIAMPAALFVDKGGRVAAPTTSRADVMAMAKTQTGRTVALNIDLRTRAFRG